MTSMARLTVLKPMTAWTAPNGRLDCVKRRGASNSGHQQQITEAAEEHEKQLKIHWMRQDAQGMWEIGEADKNREKWAKGENAEGTEDCGGDGGKQGKKGTGGKEGKCAEGRRAR